MNTTYNFNLSLKDFQQHSFTSDLQLSDALLGSIMRLKSDIVSQKLMSILSIKDNYNNITDIYNLNVDFESNAAFNKYNPVIARFLEYVTLPSQINRGQLKGNEIGQSEYTKFMQDNIKIITLHHSLEDSLESKPLKAKIKL